MIDKTKSQPLVTLPKPAPPAPPAPAEQADDHRPATTATATVAKDQGPNAATGQTSGIKLDGQGKGKPADIYDNPLDAKDSTGRAVIDAASTANTVAEAAKDARGIAGIATTVGTRVSALSRLGSGLATGLTRVADWGARVATAAPKVGTAFAGFAKAAPVVGVFMAGLDIGKAALEKDPEKKKIAIGTAALSTVSATAGIAGTAMLVTPLAPLGIGLIAVGIGASLFSFADTTFMGGKASKAIGTAVQAVDDGAKKVVGAIGDAAESVGNGAKKVWGAISSL